MSYPPGSLRFAVAAVLATGLLTTTGRAQTVLYVDANAPRASSDGSSWDHAYRCLQDALLAAAETTAEIRVAQGVYAPDQGDEQTPGDRLATFELVSGVVILGGYGGSIAPDPDRRDVMAFPTVLSGDLDGDDGLHFTGDEENCYHVVTASGVDDTAVLDGFIITRGNADGSNDYGHDKGGGMYNFDGRPVISNCRFLGNLAVTGGGMYNESGSPTITDCVFGANTAYVGGGINNSNSNPVVIRCVFGVNWADLNGAGMSNNNGSSPTILNCSFSRNQTPIDGGAMANFTTSRPTLRNCTFDENRAMDGGAVASFVGTRPTITNCRFAGNRAGQAGGAVFNNGSEAVLNNCVFQGNTADAFGGAMHNQAGDTMVVNCTFNDNSALFPDCTESCGGGMYNARSNPTVANCIFWDNNPDAFGGTGGPTVTFTDVQGGYPGAGNIDADPCFVNPDLGDLHLSSSSPCLNSGDDTVVVTDTDLDGNPRIRCFRVDMGAYESDLPQSRGDIDSDGDLDLADVAGLQGCFGAGLATSQQLEACMCIFDLDESQTLDLADFAEFQANLTGP